MLDVASREQTAAAYTWLPSLMRLKRKGWLWGDGDIRPARLRNIITSHRSSFSRFEIVEPAISHRTRQANHAAVAATFTAIVARMPSLNCKTGPTTAESHGNFPNIPRVSLRRLICASIIAA
ncbi:hypothetical protein BAUCODRAFT_332812 [Baudoinia panamericana UAMH 10762]|uniref:Uncharacterized protein n=1 Tax=Baudoinia panamericana (strain UAMH 10762) TaxID=717646 RepID=M2LAZ0_BAUPA|nr:uncharacterized protein BAUCODRAFT_332812 [Baudoinia panamericana UAMH 10762]EMC90982.1 hypothetical protein BAUCODRAFT_332812 [Baudoinia panamericana UAMH 10762]